MERFIGLTLNIMLSSIAWGRKSIYVVFYYSKTCHELNTFGEE